MNKKIIVAICLSVIIALVVFSQQKDILTDLKESADFLKKPLLFDTKNSSQNNPKITTPDIKTTIMALPDKVNLHVPFLSQAPLLNWDDLHNDACEEASLISVVRYLKGEKTISPQEGEKEIEDLVQWQMTNFGNHYDLPIAKVAEMVEKYYQMPTTIYRNEEVNLPKIQELLAENQPIILPLAGRQINNPYYRSPGPIYHMLVIRGYDQAKEQFITNDPGTKRGEEFKYSFARIMDNIYDMPAWQQNKSSLEANPDLIFSGSKAMLIIKKKGG